MATTAPFPTSQTQKSLSPLAQSPTPRRYSAQELLALPEEDHDAYISTLSQDERTALYQELQSPGFLPSDTPSQPAFTAQAQAQDQYNPDAEALKTAGKFGTSMAMSGLYSKAGQVAGGIVGARFGKPGAGAGRVVGEMAGSGLEYLTEVGLGMEDMNLLDLGIAVLSPLGERAAASGARKFLRGRKMSQIAQHKMQERAFKAFKQEEQHLLDKYNYEFPSQKVAQAQKYASDTKAYMTDMGRRWQKVALNMKKLHVTQADAIKNNILTLPRSLIDHSYNVLKEFDTVLNPTTLRSAQETVTRANRLLAETIPGMADQMLTRLGSTPPPIETPTAISQLFLGHLYGPPTAGSLLPPVPATSADAPITFQGLRATISKLTGEASRLAASSNSFDRVRRHALYEVRDSLFKTMDDATTSGQIPGHIRTLLLNTNAQYHRLLTTQELADFFTDFTVRTTTGNEILDAGKALKFLNAKTKQGELMRKNLTRIRELGNVQDVLTIMRYQTEAALRN